MCIRYGRSFILDVDKNDNDRPHTQMISFELRHTRNTVAVNVNNNEHMWNELERRQR